MFEIYRKRDGALVATFWADPYEYQTTPDANDTVQQVLFDAKSLTQTNRTPFDGEAAFPADETGEKRGGTSMEGEQPASPEYRVDHIDRTVDPGFTVVEVGEQQALGHRLEAADYSEGQEVDTPDGMGVVVEIRTEPFEGPSGDDVDGSDDNPAYVVGVESGAAVFRDSDLSAGTIDVDGVDDPSDELTVEAARAGHGPSVEALKERYTDGQIDEDRFDRLVGAALKAQMDGLEAAGDDGRQFDYPDSWDESPTPNRIILLKAWAGLGGRFTTCRRKMADDVASPARFCASMKDRVLLWEGWRQ